MFVQLGTTKKGYAAGTTPEFADVVMQPIGNLGETYNHKNVLRKKNSNVKKCQSS